MAEDHSDRPHPHGALTKREQQVADLVCRGLSNKVVARKLSLSEGTVKMHIHRVFRKLCIRNRSALILALSAGSGDRPSKD
jgi:two-component system, NarL family, nitrate/nitrite response regulator NarL